MADGVVRVVQLNAGSLLEPDWERRRTEIVTWVDELAPDIVCLQEVWEDERNSNTAAWIAAHCQADWHVAFGGDAFAPEFWPDESMRFGSAILSRFPIDDTDYTRLPVTNGESIAAKVPWELLYASTAGLDVFSTHLAPAPRDATHRRKQVVAIDEYVRSVRGDLDALTELGEVREAPPAILCGDFNADPDSDEIRYLTGLTPLDARMTFWQDAWRVAGDGPGYTQDWRTNPIAADLNVHRKRIDYIFVGDPFMRRGNAGRVLATGLAFHEPRTGVLASDHAGLVADIVWPDRP